MHTITRYIYFPNTTFKINNKTTQVFQLVLKRVKLNYFFSSSTLDCIRWFNTMILCPLAFEVFLRLLDWTTSSIFLVFSASWSADFSNAVWSFWSLFLFFFISSSSFRTVFLFKVCIFVAFSCYWSSKCALVVTAAQLNIYVLLIKYMTYS